MKKSSINHYAGILGVNPDDLTGISRKAEIQLMRKAIWCKLRSEGYELKQIASMTNRNSHSTIVSGINSFVGLVETGYPPAVLVSKALGIFSHEEFSKGRSKKP